MAFTPTRSIPRRPRPTRAQQREGSQPPVDFGGFDFSGFQGGAGPQTGAGSSSWGSFKDIFSGIFSGAQHADQPRGPQPGTDLEYQATIDFWTAIRGGQARIQINRQEICPTCHGEGARGRRDPMPRVPRHRPGNADGRPHEVQHHLPALQWYRPHCQCLSHLPRRGHLTRTENVEFRIKPGTRDGQRIRLQGKGNAGVNGGPPGDLFLIVRTGSHPVFTRQGDDIQVTVPVTVAEASLGAKVEVPTIDGRAQLKIPPGTQSGQKLRMRERGVESAQHPGQRGDEIVTVEVAVPHLNDERSREIMRELGRLNPDDPRKALFDKL